MNDFLGNRVKKAEPGEPVEILGFDSVPEAGEFVRVVENDRKARQLAGERANRLKTEPLARRSGKRISLEDIFKSDLQELNLVLKADVAGSLEAIEDEIAKLPQSEISVNVIHRGVGGINESDVMLAAASDAVVLALQRAPGRRRPPGRRSRGRRDPLLRRHLPRDRGAARGDGGHARAGGGRGPGRRPSRSARSSAPRRSASIAGSYVTDGKVTRGAKVRLVRDGTVVYDGEIGSLRRFNEDVREVASGFECGIVLQGLRRPQGGRRARGVATRKVERELRLRRRLVSQRSCAETSRRP